MFRRDTSVAPQANGVHRHSCGKTSRRGRSRVAACRALQARSLCLTQVRRIWSLFCDTHFTTRSTTRLLTYISRSHEATTTAITIRVHAQALTYDITDNAEHATRAITHDPDSSDSRTRIQTDRRSRARAPSSEPPSAPIFEGDCPDIDRTGARDHRRPSACWRCLETAAADGS